MPERPSRAQLPAARRRALLSVFFLLHWGAVIAYVLPITRESMEPFPAWLRAISVRVFPRAARFVMPVARPYLMLTSTQQHWTLFAPHPANWVSSIEVVPYFPLGGAESAEAWRVDTLLIQGPREVPYPHVLRHRPYRILFNMGYDDWGRYYRPVFAREMCRTLRDRDGRAPSGVSLLASWEPLHTPWSSEQGGSYEQWLGGYDCEPADRGPRSRPPYPVYGLPDVLDIGDWPVVHDEIRPSESGAPDDFEVPAGPGGVG